MFLAFRASELGEIVGEVSSGMSRTGLETANAVAFEKIGSPIERLTLVDLLSPCAEGDSLLDLPEIVGEFSDITTIDAKIVTSKTRIFALSFEIWRRNSGFIVHPVLLKVFRLTASELSELSVDKKTLMTLSRPSTTPDVQIYTA